MNASSLSGECARRISVVFCTAAGVDMLGPSWLSREIVTHLTRTVQTLCRRREDYDALAVLPVAVKETKVCASSGQSAEYANQEYHTPRPNVQAAHARSVIFHRGGASRIPVVRQRKAISQTVATFSAGSITGGGINSPVIFIFHRLFRKSRAPSGK